MEKIKRIESFYLKRIAELQKKVYKRAVEKTAINAQIEQLRKELELTRALYTE